MVIISAHIVFAFLVDSFACPRKLMSSLGLNQSELAEQPNTSSEIEIS
jgi:hypothetical protein